VLWLWPLILIFLTLKLTFSLNFIATPALPGAHFYIFTFTFSPPPPWALKLSYNATLRFNLSSHFCTLHYCKIQLLAGFLLGITILSLINRGFRCIRA
jgi:hypothetical protein